MTGMPERIIPALTRRQPATLIGLILLLIATPVALWTAYFVRIAASACSQRECDYDVLTPLILFLNLLPLLVAVVTIGVTLLLVSRGRNAMWLPYVGAAAVFVLPFLGMFVVAAIASSAPPEHLL